MSKTSIEWCDYTWNPTRGCSRISPGCKNCYAERSALRQKNSGYKGLVHIVNGHPAWTGEVRMVEKHIADPLHWIDPKNIFVNSMSDLWHEKLRSDDQADVYAVMAAACWHKFQVLTKRPERRLDAFSDSKFRQEVEERAIDIIANWEGRASWLGWKFQWPLPNVWEGVSVEDRLRKDRIDLLRRTPAAIRFLSVEPLLEDIGQLDLTGIHWVIVGGESGPGARPFHLEWMRSVVEECRESGVAVFCKQIGSDPYWAGYELGRAARGDSKGGDWEEWPIDLRVREFPKTNNRSCEDHVLNAPGLQEGAGFKKERSL